MSPSSSFNIVGEGLVCSGVRRAESLEEALRWFSQLLAHKSKDATFNVLFQGVHANWSLHDDIVNPLGDRRRALVTVYTFNLDLDTLFYSDASRNLQLPLHCFRNEEPGLLEEMTTFELPPAPSLRPGALPPPYWTPVPSVSARSVHFVERVLLDFGHVWRHILRREYSNYTARQFSMSILCIVGLDMDIHEESSRWLHTSMLPQRGPYVWIHSRPAWKPCDVKVFRLGNITVVLDQNLEQALSTAEADWKSLPRTGTSDGMFYLLISVRHVALYRVEGPRYTKPAALWNGTDGPSHAAVIILIQAAAYAFPSPPRMPIHKPLLSFKTVF